MHSAGMDGTAGEQLKPTNGDSGVAYPKAVARATARISAQGIAVGYTSGISVLVLCLIPVTLLNGSTWGVRVAIGISGIWWGVATLPSAIWLRANEDERNAKKVADEASVGREILKAWRKLGDMLRPVEVKKLKNTFWFLAAWFLLSDGEYDSPSNHETNHLANLDTNRLCDDEGFTSITSTAVLFASTTLGMPTSSLILVMILSPLAGILGSLAWPRLQKRMEWTNERALVWLVVGAAIVPAYGCLGFLIEGGHGLRFGGLTTPAEVRTYVSE